MKRLLCVGALNRMGLILRCLSVSLAAVLLVSGTMQFAYAKVETTELFGFDQTIQVFDRNGAPIENKDSIASGSKVGVEGSLATLGITNAGKVNASVTAGKNGDALQLRYTQKLASQNNADYLKIDSLAPIDYTTITEDNPVILEFNVKPEWENTTTMNAWIDVAPVIKPETGTILEGTSFVQQSVQTADNGKWLAVKYVIGQVKVNEDANNTASFTFDRYIGTDKQNLSDANRTKAMGANSGAGAALIGFRVQAKARATAYNEGGYLNLTFDSLRVYREKTVVPTGTKWGEDLTVKGENQPGAVANGTVIGDANTRTEYKLTNADGSTAGYSAEIAADNASLVVKNVASSDGYKSKLEPVSPKTYQAADIPENGALVYEAKYTLDYQRDSQDRSYSAVQMYFDFYKNSKNQTMQFPVPATTTESGREITVRVVIPRGTLEGKTMPCLFADGQAMPLPASLNLNDLEYVKPMRVLLSNKVRAGQTVGEADSAVTLTLDYLDEYIIEDCTLSWGDCKASGGSVAYEIQNTTGGTAAGVVYAAVFDAETERLRACGTESVTVQDQDTYKGTITLESALDSESQVCLFFWDGRTLTPYLEKQNVSVEAANNGR